MWHSVSEDRDVLRQGYMETIIPPFAALLRRWRPLLSGIHELTDAQGQSPLAVEYHHLASDMHPLEVDNPLHQVFALNLFRPTGGNRML